MNLALRLRLAIDRRWPEDERRKSSKGVTELAAESGVDQGTISLILAGKRADPSMSTLVRIAEALGVTIDWLSTGREPMLRQDVATMNDILDQVRQLKGCPAELPAASRVVNKKR